MKTSPVKLADLKINNYEDPFLQHQYVCLGHKIAIIRLSMNMSQKELAHLVGISRSYLSKLECGIGISGVSVEILFKIAQSLQINIGKLMHLRIKDYKTCNAHLTAHYKRMEFLNRHKE